MNISLSEALYGDQNWLVGITYEIWNADYMHREEPSQKGWELEYTPSTDTDLIMIAGTYGIQPNDMDIENRWDNEDVVPKDGMTGDETCYQMHIKHLDGSDLSVAERSRINKMLTG